MLDGLKAAASARLEASGWTGTILADAKRAVERVEAVADRLGVVLAQMQAENAAHRSLVDEMRGERHRLEVLAVRLDAALNPPCKHPVIVYPGDGGGSYCGNPTCGERLE